MQRLLNRALSSAFFAWTVHCSHHKTDDAAMQAMLRLRHQSIMRGFAAWQCLAQAQAEAVEALQLSMLRWQQQAVVGCWLHWRTCVCLHQQRQACLQLSVQRWQRGCLLASKTSSLQGPGAGVQQGAGCGGGGTR